MQPSPAEAKAAAAKAKADPKAAAAAAEAAVAALAAQPVVPCCLLSPALAAQLNPITVTPRKVQPCSTSSRHRMLPETKTSSQITFMVPMLMACIPAPAPCLLACNPDPRSMQLAAQDVFELQQPNQLKHTQFPEFIIMFLVDFIG